jgi:hypothetical protein
MDVAPELLLRRCIQQPYVARVCAAGSSDSLKGSENVRNHSTRLAEADARPWFRAAVIAVSLTSE